jgi:hypothetical protein
MKMHWNPLVTIYMCLFFPLAIISWGMFFIWIFTGWYIIHPYFLLCGGVGTTGLFLEAYLFQKQFPTWEDYNKWKEEHLASKK